MIAITNEEFAIMKPIAWVITLIIVTFQPPMLTYASMKPRKNRRRNQRITYSTRYSFCFGLNTNKQTMNIPETPIKAERVIIG